MDNLHILATKRTPEIHFKADGDLLIKGVSIPENVIEFYKPAMDWLEKLKPNCPQKINLSINFEYLNTSSTSHVLKLLKKVLELPVQKMNLNITWLHDDDDDDMIEQGSIMQNIINHPFLFQVREEV